MSRMFKTIDVTWNPFVGCRFDCIYCYARDNIAPRLRHLPQYAADFRPTFVEKALKRRFQPGQFVAVSLMGDISWAKREEVLKILAVIENFPRTSFLIQSKNPRCFWEFSFPSNVYLGTTIETNREYGLTKAPSSFIRYADLQFIRHPYKFISIEPIMDFDLEVLMQWLDCIRPGIVEVGADNYRNHLPEPPWWKVKMLLENLRDICPRVVEKEGLERLKGVSLKREVK